MMPDREKVIKGLECCNYYGFHEDCPYDKKDPNEEQDTTCMMDLMRDALALLKEQEAVVRCKDCKKYGDNKKCPIEALINSDSKQFFAFDENWFCADGVVKDINVRSRNEVMKWIKDI